MQIRGGTGVKTYDIEDSMFQHSHGSPVMGVSEAVKEALHKPLGHGLPGVLPGHHPDHPLVLAWVTYDQMREHLVQSLLGLKTAWYAFSKNCSAVCNVEFDEIKWLHELRLLK